MINKGIYQWVPIYLVRHLIKLLVLLQLIGICTNMWISYSNAIKKNSYETVGNDQCIKITQIDAIQGET